MMVTVVGLKWGMHVSLAGVSLIAGLEYGMENGMEHGMEHGMEQ